MARQNELNGKLSSLRAVEERVAIEVEDLKREMGEAGMLVGREAFDYAALLSTAEEIVAVTGEVRTMQMERRRAIEKIKIRPLLALIGCVLFFAVTINPLGLLISLTITTFLSAFAGDEVRIGEAIALSIGLTLLSLVIFVLILGLPLPVWPSL